MVQKKGSLDFLEGVTEETVEWRMLNMDSELVTANLSRTIGARHSQHPQTPLGF